MIIFILIILLYNKFYIEQFIPKQEDILFPSKKINYIKIVNRFKFLLKQLNINYYKISLKDFKLFIIKYKHLYTSYIVKNIEYIFTSLDLYNRKYLTVENLVYLYFVKKNYLDKSIYNWNKIHNNLFKETEKEYIPSNIFSNLNHIINISKDLHSVNNPNINVKPYNDNNIIGITNYKRNIINRLKKPFKKCKFNICNGYDNSIIYYGMNENI